jgi:hypothetical protein
MPLDLCYLSPMSVAEIKAEILKLTPEEKKELHDALAASLATPDQPIDVSQYLGCMRGTAVLKPGWDNDEPLEAWDALRDDTSA